MGWRGTDSARAATRMLRGGGRTGYGVRRPGMKPVSGAGGTRRSRAAGTGAGRPRLRGWASSGATLTVTALHAGEVESGGAGALRLADGLRGLTTSLPDRAKPVGFDTSDAKAVTTWFVGGLMPQVQRCCHGPVCVGDITTATLPRGPLGTASCCLQSESLGMGRQGRLAC